MKTVEERLNILEKTLKNLQDSFIQAQKNLSPTTAKVDDTANKVDAITPYKETKTAYIGDKSISFLNVPNGGNLTVYGLDTLDTYKTTRTSYNAVLIEWETPLEEVTEVTISIS